jgi:hypothetical protein
MALHEWIETDGNIVRFDTNTDLIQYFTPSYIPLSDPRTPTQFEIDRHTQLFPLDETGGVTTAAAVAARASIDAAAQDLADVVNDPNASREDIIDATQGVLGTLGVVGELSPELVGGDVAHSTILLLSQIVRGLTRRGESADTGLAALTTSISQYNTDLDSLVSDVAAIQEQLP